MKLAGAALGASLRNAGAAADFVEKLQESGRVGFPLGALVRETGLNPAAARMQLSRLDQVVQLYPRSDFYLAVEPIHRNAGAPPVEWWIDDFFADLGVPYYIGLLSAAAAHGSSPQAIQVTQVVVDAFRPVLRVGRRRIQFVVKQRADDTPAMTPRGSRVPVKVSTPEATFLDLIRYQKKVGGWPRVMDVIEGLTFSTDGMVAALAQDLEVSLMQRAGFLLAAMKKDSLADLVRTRLSRRRLHPTSISMSSEPDAEKITENPWKVHGTLGEKERIVISLTEMDVREHQKTVPWTDDMQVEQDLMLSLAMVAIFQDEFLREHIAMRGGTALHKIHLAPPARYSEDIDLVAITKRDEKHIAAGLKRVLLPILGERVNSMFDKAALKVRNAFSASRILRMEYVMPSVMAPARQMKIKIETNVSERTPFMTPTHMHYQVPFQGSGKRAEIVSFDLNEMLGTKMRALFQRDAGRDLFDLYSAKVGTGFDAVKTINAFNHYMAGEKKTVGRADFLEAFGRKRANAAFRSDMETLLRSDLDYDFNTAADWVETNLLERLQK